MSEKNHRARPKSLFLAVGLVILTGFGWANAAVAQESKGENFSAKPPAQLFNSDCTGSGCHKGPQGLAKNYSTGGLASFLREHYTNSRESAAALAAYLTKQPTGPEPKEKEARTPRGTKPTAAAPSLSGPAGWFQSSPEPAAAKPKEKEKDKEKPAARPEPRTSTAAHHEEPPSTQRHDIEHGNEARKPSARERAQRGRHPAAPATAAVPPAETPAPAAPSASEGETPKPAAPAVAAAPQPMPPPAPSSPPAAAPAPAPTAAAKAAPAAGAKKQYDIFD